MTSRGRAAAVSVAGPHPRRGSSGAKRRRIFSTQEVRRARLTTGQGPGECPDRGTSTTPYQQTLDHEARRALAVTGQCLFARGNWLVHARKFVLAAGKSVATLSRIKARVDQQARHD